MRDNNIIYDIETMQECFIVVCMKPEQTPKSFVVSRWKNQLDSFVKYTEENKSEFYKLAKILKKYNRKTIFF